VAEKVAAEAGEPIYIIHLRASDQETTVRPRSAVA
jgi:hypothetical protein